MEHSVKKRDPRREDSAAPPPVSQEFSSDEVPTTPGRLSLPPAHHVGRFPRRTRILTPAPQPAQNFPSWEQATITQLEVQISRIKAGVACPSCRGAGELLIPPSVGAQIKNSVTLSCGDCDGSGFRRG